MTLRILYRDSPPPTSVLQAKQKRPAMMQGLTAVISVCGRLIQPTVNVPQMERCNILIKNPQTKIKTDGFGFIGCGGQC